MRVHRAYYHAATGALAIVGTSEALGGQAARPGIGSATTASRTGSVATASGQITYFQQAVHANASQLDRACDAARGPPRGVFED